LKNLVKHIAILIIFCSTSTWANFQDSKITEPNVIATVDKIVITTDEFINSYEFGPSFVKKQPDSKLKHLNYMIDEKLLSLYGKELGLDSTAQVREVAEAFKNDIITEAMFKEEILPKVEYSEEEIDSLVVQKSLELQIRWLFSNEDDEINHFYSALESGVRFDTLFSKQIRDSIYYDMRSMNITRYNLGKKNPLLASVIDTLQAGNYSLPIKTGDGWYIVELNNVLQNMVYSESDLLRLRKESVEAITKIKTDELSDAFIKKLYNSSNPVVNKSTFNIALAHTANFILTKELYQEWEIADLLKESLSGIGTIGKDEIGELHLVNMEDGVITLNEFMIWFRTMFQNLKFEKSSLNKYGYSLYSVVQRMIRDRLLIRHAYENDYQYTPGIESELKWWMDKIVFSAVRNEIMNSIYLENNEKVPSSPSANESVTEKLNTELSIKLYRLLKELRGKYDISINKELLKSVKVSEENNFQAIDLYAVKKGGLMPRTPYPTIDNDWQYWQ